MNRLFLMLLCCAALVAAFGGTFVPAAAQTPNREQLEKERTEKALQDSINWEKSLTRKRLSFGPFAGFNLNQHLANFRALSGDDGYNATAPNFGGGFGAGFTAGALLDVPFSDVVSLGIRAAFGTFGAELQAPEPQRIGVLDASGNNVTFYDATFARSLRPTLNNAFAEAMASLSPFEAVDLRFHIGGRVGLYLAPSYTQSEKILEPSDPLAVFQLTGSTNKERNVRSGTIPNANALNLAAIVGLSYDIYTMKDPRHEAGFIISPEVFVSYGLNPVASGMNNGSTWSVVSGRAGLSARFLVPPPPQPPPPAPLPPPEPELKARVTAYGIDTNGVESPLVKIRVEEFLSRQLYPMLGFIFFDAAASELPKKYVRYLREAESFDEEVENFGQRFYRSDMMKVYYDILNIIGNRLKEKPSIKITLVGCNDNTAGEANNMQLSMERALTVRNYLKQYWEIDTSRMEIKARNLPERATNSVDSAGMQENRRVEIIPSDPSLLDPLLVFDTLSVSSIQKIRFQLDSKAEAGYKEAKLLATQGSRALKNYITPGKDADNFIWNLADEPGTMPRVEEDLEYTYTVTDTRDVSKSDDNSIPIEYVSVRKKRSNKIKDKMVDTYRLISFGFNSTDVGDQNSKVVNEYINPNLSANSRISTIGYTDRLGNPEVNQRLSDGRAKSVANSLKTGKITSLGVGARKPLYNNETPEGRFYNRTVEVRVETTVE